MCQVEPRAHCKTSWGKSWVSWKTQNESQGLLLGDKRKQRQGGTVRKRGWKAMDFIINIVETTINGTEIMTLTCNSRLPSTVGEHGCGQRARTEGGWSAGTLSRWDAEERWLGGGFEQSQKVS